MPLVNAPRIELQQQTGKEEMLSRIQVVLRREVEHEHERGMEEDRARIARARSPVCIERALLTLCDCDLGSGRCDFEIAIAIGWTRGEERMPGSAVTDIEIEDCRWDDKEGETGYVSEIDDEVEEVSEP